MKIDFEGEVRTLDLNHIRLRHGITIQEFTGLPLADWQRALFSRDMDALTGAATVTQVAGKMTAYTDTGWIVNMAAAHWLMLAQNGDAPELDGEYDVDILGFTEALYAAAMEEIKAKQVQDKPAPKASRAQRTPSSRQTATRSRKPLPPAVPPSTGS